MLADGVSVEVPLALRAAPAAIEKVPLPSVKAKARVPLLISTVPELAHAIVTELVPVPALFRSVPALSKIGVPELKTNEEPSPCSSKVAHGALLNTDAPLQVTCPAIRAPAPPLINVPPCRVLVPAVLIVMLLLATRVNPEPGPKIPPVQVNAPPTATVLLPVSVPEFNVT